MDQLHVEPLITLTEASDRLILTNDEAATLLGTDRKTIQNYINEGAIPTTPYGSRRLVDAQALLRLLAEQP